MGAQFQKSKYEYKSDDGNTYIVGLRDEVADLGGFVPESDNFIDNYPRAFRMRRVIGIERGTGNKHVQPVADPSHPLFNSAPGFWYLSHYFTITAILSEKRPDKY